MVLPMKKATMKPAKRSTKAAVKRAIPQSTKAAMKNIPQSMKAAMKEAMKHVKKVKKIALRCNDYHLSWLNSRVDMVEVAISELHEAINRLEGR